MHIHDFNVEVTKVATVNATTNTFSFPTDFVRYVAIATVIDGRWWIYTRDDTMAPLNDDDSVSIQDSLINIANYEPFDSYGKAGGTNKYYFRPDYKNRRFQVKIWQKQDNRLFLLRSTSCNNGCDKQLSCNRNTIKA